jgi:hypothetical protein
MRAISDTPPLDRLIAELADAQHGVVSHGQLLELGLSASGVQRRLAAHRLHRIYPRAYAVGRRRIDHRGWWKAATLSVGGGAVLSYTSAAALWGLIKPRQRVEITIPSTAGRPSRRGLTIHRSRSLPDQDATTRDNIPVTSLARTLLDLSTLFERRQLEKVLDEASYLRLYDGITLSRVIEDHPERASRLKACIEEHVIGSTRANEGLEERFFLLCRRHGLPEPLVHEPIGPYEVDFLWREQRVIVETDDRASHLRAASFERDHRKTAYLQDLSYDVRRVTSRMLDRDETGVMNAVKRRLAVGP